MNYRPQIHDYIQNHKKEIAETLKQLVEIPSVIGKAEKNAPFGRNCADVLKLTEELYSNNGFETELDQNSGYLLAYYGKGEKSLGLFAHADVVPVDDEWVFTNPFKPLEKDGFIIGRGVTDDKAAVVISLYCAKILKELNIPFNSRLVMFTGANEESGMDDIRAYVKSHKAPDFSLVCDAAFPLFRGDKGILHFMATSNKKMEEVTDFYGGQAYNIVLGKASAVIGGKTVTANGMSRHAALPEGSVNAGYLLSKRLADDNTLCESDRKQMKFISSLLEKYYGEIFGLEDDDAVFGKLTVINGIVKMTDGKIGLSFDMRYGMSADVENARTKIKEFFNKNNWSVEFFDKGKPFLMPLDDPYLKKCLDTYIKYTGDNNAQPYINAGATYARCLPKAVEIGTSVGGNGTLSGMPQGHGGVHQPDECINEEGLLNAIELTMLMLIECDKI